VQIDLRVGNVRNDDPGLIEPFIQRRQVPALSATRWSNSPTSFGGNAR
jgi:hypothetical protein